MNKLWYIIFPFVFVNTCFAQDNFTRQVIERTMVQVAPTSLPTAFPTQATFNDTSNKTSITIVNGYNQDVWCGYGTNTPVPFVVPAGSAFTDNFTARNERLTTGVSCIHPSSTPASGTLSIFGTSH